MPRGIGPRPGSILLFIVITVLAILAIVDLSGPNSTLASLWRQTFPAQTQGEQLRDGVMDRIRPPR